MIFLLLLGAALVGPLALGVAAGHEQDELPRLAMMGVAILLPVLLWAALWLFERIAAHGANLSGSGSDGDLGIVLAREASILLLPVSFGLAFLGKRIGRR